jgi:non-specific serine/threonine protein kinase
LRRGDFGRARAALGESSVLRLNHGDHGGIAWCLEKLAEALALEAETLPAARRQPAQAVAAQLFGSAEALRAPLNSVIDPADVPDYERLVAELRAALGDTAFDEAWQAGGALPLADAIALGLRGAAAEAPSAKASFDGLTAREVETARLIARGLSNREIAAAMVVSAKTVETYVTRILGKLGLSSRTQIALWAAERGLTSDITG